MRARAQFSKKNTCLKLPNNSTIKFNQINGYYLINSALLIENQNSR